MAEVKTLIDGKVVEYRGLFRTAELYGIIRRFLRERGYYLIETRNEEQILDAGKQVIITLEPLKTLSDYAKSALRVDIRIQGLKDKLVTVDGHKQQYQQGSVSIKCSAFLRTDYRNRWEKSGGWFVFRVLTNKFIRHDMIARAEENTAKDLNDLLEETRSYLNMSRFKLEHNAEQKKTDFS